MMDKTYNHFLQELQQLIREARELGAEDHPSFDRLKADALRTRGRTGWQHQKRRIRDLLQDWRRKQELHSPLGRAPHTSTPKSRESYFLGTIQGAHRGVELHLSLDELCAGTAITGDSGVGKTVLQRDLVHHFHALPNVRTIIVDNRKREYSGLVFDLNDVASINLRHARLSLFRLFDLPFEGMVESLLSNILAFLPARDSSNSVQREVIFDLHRKQDHFSIEELIAYTTPRNTRSAKAAYVESAKQVQMILAGAFQGSRNIRDGWKIDALLRDFKTLILDPSEILANVLAFFLSHLVDCLMQHQSHHFQRTREYIAIIFAEAQGPFARALYPRETPGQATLTDFPDKARALGLIPVYDFLRPASVLGNLLSTSQVISFRLRNEDDKRVVSRSVGLRNPEHLSKTKHGTAIVAYPGYDAPLLVNLACKPRGARTPSQEEVAEHMKAYLDRVPISTDHLQATRAERDPQERRQGPKPTTAKKARGARTLFHRIRHHTEPITKSYKAINLSAGGGARALKTLQERGHIEKIALSTGRRGGKMIVATPTQEGALFYGVPYEPLPGRGSLEAKAWAQIARRWLEANGYKNIQVEAMVADTRKAADLTAHDTQGRLVAIELEITSKVSGTTRNVEADLEGADHIRTYFKTQRKLEHHRAAVLKRLPIAHQDSVSFHLLAELLEVFHD